MHHMTDETRKYFGYTRRKRIFYRKCFSFSRKRCELGATRPLLTIHRAKWTLFFVVGKNATVLFVFFQWFFLLADVSIANLPHRCELQPNSYCCFSFWIWLFGQSLDQQVNPFVWKLLSIRFELKCSYCLEVAYTNTHFKANTH